MNKELLLVLIIIGSAALAVALSAAVAIRWVIRQGWKNKDVSFTPLDKVILAGGASVLLCYLWATFVEPFWLEVTHSSIQSTKIPASSKGFRIAHISDIHSDPNARLEEKLPAAIAAEKPDIIVFTGDCLNKQESLPVFNKMLVEVSKIAPTFVVRGNWDAWYWNKLDLFGGSSAIELNGNSKNIELNGAPVSVLGFPVMPARGTGPAGGEEALESALKKIPAGHFSIFLYHYPDLIDEVRNQKIDLYCAGHTHGGQVRLPLYGALVTLSKFGKKYEAGPYHEKDTMLYVNRGIGMEGGIAPRVRFLCRPELAIIDVAPKDELRSER
jgi:predicted MPP superfamily phosphohydrolase